MRPSGAKRIAVGHDRLLQTTESWKPVGSVAAGVEAPAGAEVPALGEPLAGSAGDRGDADLRLRRPEVGDAPVPAPEDEVVEAGTRRRAPAQDPPSPYDLRLRRGSAPLGLGLGGEDAARPLR